MIIYVDTIGKVQLREPDNFKGFKIVVAPADMSHMSIADALAGIATVEADGKTAWVSQHALRSWDNRPQLAEWVAAFEKMVESVKRFGWVNEADETVHAHIETEQPTP